MTAFIRPEFTPGTLPTHLGYHLQIFAAGRAKISLQTENKKKIEFYTALPKRDRDGLRRQNARSLAALPDHFAAVDELLSKHPDAKVFRIHEKGNNNGTADNAHLLASMEADALWLVMSGVVHRWALTAALVHVLIEGKGEKTGVPSLFNEYMPSYEHDWQDAEFEIADYRVGHRDVRGQTVEAPQLARPSQPTPTIKSNISAQPPTKVAPANVPDDAAHDPAIPYDPEYAPPYEPFSDQTEGDTALDTKAFKGGTAYGKAGLWAAYKDSGKQTGQHPTS